MNGGRIHIGMLLALGLTTALVQPAAAQGLKAKIQLTHDRNWDVEFLRREEGGQVVIREKGKDFEIGLRPEDFKLVEFDIDLEKARVYELYNRGEFETASATLDGLLRPAFPYLNLPSNLAEGMTLYVRCLYWQRRHDAVLTIAHLMEVISDPVARNEGRVYRALALIETGRLREAEVELNKVGTLHPRDELACSYHYARCRLQLTKGQWVAAQESAAYVIAFHPRNFQWMPPALLASAEAYGKGGHDEVARQVIDEIGLIAPESYWSRQAAALTGHLAEFRQAEEARKAEEAKQAAAKAAGATPAPNP